MRVLHAAAYFAPAFGYGGPPRSILGLCRGLARIGVDVEVFTTTAGDLPPAAHPGARYEGVPVRYFPLRAPRRLFAARGLAQAIEAEVGRFDLAHAHGLWNLPAWTAAREARRAGVPYVLSPRGMLEPAALARRAGWKRLAHALVEKRNIEGAALLHATSAAEAAAIARRAAGAPLAVVPNAVERPADAPPAPGAWRSRMGIGPDVPLVAFLGRIHPVKRLDLLAAALDLVHRQAPEVRLVVAGPDEHGHRRAVEPRFAAAGSRVSWTGPLGDRDKWALLDDADCLVLCSDSESFGLAAAEALAAGVPVVATRTCPWHELVTARAGYWVEQTAPDIAAALLAIAGDRPAARAMGARGRELARAAFGWEPVARAMAAVYERALAGPRLARAG